MNVLEYLKDNILFLDGSMGTLLQSRGLKPGEFPEMWNISHPEVITEIHKAYFDAGANVVCTNTFGANALKYNSCDLAKIVKAAVKNAVNAAKQSSSDALKWVALDIGPTGKMLAPYGDLSFEDAVDIFSEIVKIGAEENVDLIIIETMSDSLETKAALLAANENSDLPVFVSNAYGQDGKLLTGASPEVMVAMLEGMGADVIGLNCSFGPKTMEPIVKRYLAAASVPVMLKPNAGLPRVENGRTVYDVLPNEFAMDVAQMVKAGVSAVGGCCGTSPEFIQELVKTCKGMSPAKIDKKKETVISSYTHTLTIGNAPILIGERINPTGKKTFKEALRNGDIGYILKEAISQEEAGAHVLDVNVGLPEIDECRMLKSAVFEIQTVTDLPLQIDTSNASAMEAALRIYNGKPMINSVNGGQKSMDAVFPLVKKYGGVVVALTLDENGIPSTAQGRLAIAERILAEAKKYNIDKKDIVFDPLALTISADSTSAVETLKAIKLIKEKLGCNTVLGVSNVSFGLPGREAINASYFTLAMWQGLSAGIINPHNFEIQKAYHSFLALSGQDDNCLSYIQFADSALKQNIKTEVVPANSANVGVGLKKAIEKGLKTDAAEYTVSLLASKDPLGIISQDIVPALNTVGDGFEKGSVYLPQLLMSAEAAGMAFAEIKKVLPASEAKRCAVVLATVKGDIHDIGKNIVRLLLENYGFAVTDLGRDVAPETILSAVQKLNAPIVGLCALMTTTVPAMEETILLLRKHAPWCKVMVGGAVMTKEYAAKIGADQYAKDAMEAVRYAESVDENR